jgi:chromosome segregation ATPase
MTPPEWRDDLLAQVARLEDEKRAGYQREAESKARVIDLERAATVRESRIADLEQTIGARDSRIADLETTHASELSELRGQVAILEAKVRETLEERAEENGQLANRIADLVTAHTEMQARVVELQPVAERVPMLEAAVDEKDAELSDIQADIEAIANRPVAGPVFRYLTKGRLRR